MSWLPQDWALLAYLCRQAVSTSEWDIWIYQGRRAAHPRWVDASVPRQYEWVACGLHKFTALPGSLVQRLLTIPRDLGAWWVIRTTRTTRTTHQSSSGKFGNRLASLGLTTPIISNPGEMVPWENSGSTELRQPIWMLEVRMDPADWRHDHEWTKQQLGDVRTTINVYKYVDEGRPSIIWATTLEISGD